MLRRRIVSGSADAFWSEPLEALLERLGSARQGLSAAEAALRLRRQGPNALRPPSRFAPLRLLARQFESPLVAILVFAAIVAAIVRDWTDAAIVLLILLGSGLLGFAQEYRASTAVEKLRARVRARARVLRDGAPLSLPIEAACRTSAGSRSWGASRSPRGAFRSS